MGIEREPVRARKKDKGVERKRGRGGRGRDEKRGAEEGKRREEGGKGRGRNEKRGMAKRILNELFTNTLIPSVDSTRLSVRPLRYTYTSHQSLFTFCK